MAPLGRQLPGLPAGGRRLRAGFPAAAAAGPEALVRGKVRRRDRPPWPHGLGPGASLGGRGLGLPRGLLQRGTGLGRHPHDLRQAPVDLLVLGRVREALPPGRALRGREQRGANRRRPRPARFGPRQPVADGPVAARCGRGHSSSGPCRFRHSASRSGRLRGSASRSSGLRCSASPLRLASGLLPPLRRASAPRRLLRLASAVLLQVSGLASPLRLVLPRGTALRLLQGHPVRHKPTAAFRSSPLLLPDRLALRRRMAAFRSSPPCPVECSLRAACRCMREGPPAFLRGAGRRGFSSSFWASARCSWSPWSSCSSSTSGITSPRNRCTRRRTGTTADAEARGGAHRRSRPSARYGQGDGSIGSGDAPPRVGARVHPVDRAGSTRPVSRGHMAGDAGPVGWCGRSMRSGVHVRMAQGADPPRPGCRSPEVRVSVP